VHLPDRLTWSSPHPRSSTIPVTTGETMRKVLHAVGDAAKYEVLCFPSFYRGGQAVKDLEMPQRVLLGAQDTPSAIIAQEAVTQLLSRWIRASPPLLCPHALYVP